jgi:hypothetical protein
MNHSRTSRFSVPLALAWTRRGASYRITPWPDVQIEQRYGTEWVPVTLTPAQLTGAELHPGAWRAYLEFVPSDVRELVSLFRTNRLLALQVASRCPELVGALTETPALATFVTCHAQLRGSPMERWDELNAQFERGGIFSVLDWLGMPATRQTIAILTSLIAADLAPRLAEPVRAALWRPTGILSLAATSHDTDRDLADSCALAA